MALPSLLLRHASSRVSCSAMASRVSCSAMASRNPDPPMASRVSCSAMASRVSFPPCSRSPFRHGPPETLDPPCLPSLQSTMAPGVPWPALEAFHVSPTSWLLLQPSRAPAPPPSMLLLRRGTPRPPLSGRGDNCHMFLFRLVTFCPYLVFPVLVSLINSLSFKSYHLCLLIILFSSFVCPFNKSSVLPLSFVWVNVIM